MLRDVYQALADTIADELDFGTMDVTVEPRMVLQPGELPCIDMYRGRRTIQEAGFGDISGMEVAIVRVRVSPNDRDESQDLLTDLTDDTHDLCMAVALEADQQLGGWATSVDVDGDEISETLDFSTTATPMIGVTWRVLIARAES